MGNRTSQIAPSGQTLYSYDGNNRLTQAGAVVYSYDPNGNLTGTSAGQSFTYDPFNRMTQAVGTGGTATYTYDGDGLKIQRVGPDGATRYYYDGIRPIWETDWAGAMTAQLDRDIFGNLLSRREASGTRRYYHTDGLGSTVALTDETGATAASMLYDAWGNVRTSSGSGHGKYRFTGAELDSASDLYHMGARFYDPSIGRWLGEDPVQSPFEPASLNFYAYVANNPLIMIDPAGMRPTGPCDDGGCSGSTQEVVAGWVNEYGETGALERVRQAWRTLDRILGVLNDLGITNASLSFADVIKAANKARSYGYLDINVSIGRGVNLTIGFIITATAETRWYVGVAIGTPGATITASLQNVTPGWNIAFTAGYRGLAGQIGLALDCVSNCSYWEVGYGSPGFQFMAFYVF